MMNSSQEIFSRMSLLVGEEVMTRISQTKVILFGVGGVGSWCAESLVRSGIRHLTIVDSDRVSITNCNRQLLATTETVGKVKVEVLKERLLSINPEAEITAIQAIYSPETSDSFQLDTYDYIIDAIDSLSNKIHLILAATQTRAVLFSSMGAALKMDPLGIKVAEFWKVRGCPLGAALRKQMKRKKTYPSKKFLCVYSEELLPNLGEVLPVYESWQSEAEGDPSLAAHDWTATKAQVNGTVAHITALFGFTIAGLLIKNIVNKGKEEIAE